MTEPFDWKAAMDTFADDWEPPKPVFVKVNAKIVFGDDEWHDVKVSEFIPAGGGKNYWIHLPIPESLIDIESRSISILDADQISEILSRSVATGRGKK